MTATSKRKRVDLEERIYIGQLLDEGRSFEQIWEMTNLNMTELGEVIADITKARQAASKKEAGTYVYFEPDPRRDEEVKVKN